MQNGFIESFNGRLRDELLNENLFASIDDARQQIVVWKGHYNQCRPHSALSGACMTQVFGNLGFQCMLNQNLGELLEPPFPPIRPSSLR